MKMTITKDGMVFKDDILLKPRLIRDICNKYSIGHTTLNNYLRRLNIVRHR